MVDDALIPRPKETLEVTELDDGYIIQEGNNVHILNQTGKKILELCDGERTIRQIKEAMRDTYGEEHNTGYVNDFIQNLLETGLIQLP
jgi:hypothetical protein